MLKLKDAGKQPANTGGNDKHASAPGTPGDAVGRSGGSPGRQISDQIPTTKVSRAELTKALP